MLPLEELTNPFICISRNTQNFKPPFLMHRFLALQMYYCYCVCEEHTFSVQIPRFYLLDITSKFCTFSMFVGS